MKAVGWDCCRLMWLMEKFEGGQGPGCVVLVMNLSKAEWAKPAVMFAFIYCLGQSESLRTTADLGNYVNQ